LYFGAYEQKVSYLQIFDEQNQHPGSVKLES